MSPGDTTPSFGSPSDPPPSIVLGSGGLNGWRREVGVSTFQTGSPETMLHWVEGPVPTTRLLHSVSSRLTEPQRGSPVRTSFGGVGRFLWDKIRYTRSPHLFGRFPLSPSPVTFFPVPCPSHGKGTLHRTPTTLSRVPRGPSTTRSIHSDGVRDVVQSEPWGQVPVPDVDVTDSSVAPGKGETSYRRDTPL